jgi:magnesium transporter
MVMHRRLDPRTLADDPQGSVHLFIRPEAGERKTLLDWGLDAHTLRSALDPEEVPRFEQGKGHCALLLKQPLGEKGKGIGSRVGSFGLFLFKRRLVLVTSEGMPPFGLGHRDGTLPGVVLLVLDGLIVDLLERLGLIAREADRIQEKLASAMENKHLLSLFSLQKALVYYESALNSNSAVLEILGRHARRAGFDRGQRDLLEDVLVENRQCYRQVEDLTDVLSNLMDARASIVNNNLNILIKFLNLLMLAVMVPTLVVSVFSMNVRLPFQEEPMAFYGVLGLAFLAAGVFLGYWRGRRW